MPPKPAVKKYIAPIVRPSISSSSLHFIPQDAVEGYQERIETGINWTLIEKAAREHKDKCLEKHLINIGFKEALNKKMCKSILRIFLDENSGISLKSLWEFSLPVTFWDNDKFGNEETKISFVNHNNITDKIESIIKKAVDEDDRKQIIQELKKTDILRVIDSCMTHIDLSLKEYYNLKILNLSANCLSCINVECIPATLEILELQSNQIVSMNDFSEVLPKSLIYLGLSRNLLTNDSFEGILNLKHIVVLDLSDNDIYEIDKVLYKISKLSQLRSLNLFGNPCSVCAAYAYMTLMILPNLLWLDGKEIMASDRPQPEDIVLNPVHPDDLRSAYFVFSIIRIISLPPPPKIDKGIAISYHVELELPFLDSKRRQFLMYRRNESLEQLNIIHNDSVVLSKTPSNTLSIAPEGSNITQNNIYNNLIPKPSQTSVNFTTFESNKVQWNKIMTFQVPTIRIFCPDLRALRDTFRTEVSLRVIYTVSNATKNKPPKSEKKSVMSLKAYNDQYCVLASIKCKLEKVDWKQPQQQFQWDDTLETEYALPWNDEDLFVIQYSQGPAKVIKGKSDTNVNRKTPPENFTCQFGFSIETLKPQY